MSHSHVTIFGLISPSHDTDCSWFSHEMVVNWCYLLFSQLTVWAMHWVVCEPPPPHPCGQAPCLSSSRVAFQEGPYFPAKPLSKYLTVT